MGVNVHSIDCGICALISGYHILQMEDGAFLHLEATKELKKKSNPMLIQSIIMINLKVLNI